jgi:hypothetical protein
MVSDFSWRPSAVLILLISSRYLVILVNPTSKYDEISGTGGGASLWFSPALLPPLLASCLFLFLLRLPFEEAACIAR